MAENLARSQGLRKSEAIQSRQFSGFAEAENVLRIKRNREFESDAWSDFLLGKSICPA